MKKSKIPRPVTSAGSLPPLKKKIYSQKLRSLIPVRSSV